MRTVTSLLVNGDGRVSGNKWQDVKVGTSLTNLVSLSGSILASFSPRNGDTEGNYYQVDPETTISVTGDFANETVSILRDDPLEDLIAGGGGGGVCVASFSSVCPSTTAQGQWISSGGKNPNNTGNPRYSFKVTSGGTVTIDLASSTDPYLYLLDSFGNVITQDDNSGGGQKARIQRVMTVGTYYIVAATTLAFQKDNFTLALQGPASNLALASGNNGSNDPPIYRTMQATGFWAGSGGSNLASMDNPRYFFIVNQAGQVSINLKSTVAYTNLFMIADQNGQITVFHKDIAQKTTSTISTYLLPGTYTLVAATYYTNAYGKFELSVEGYVSSLRPQPAYLPFGSVLVAEGYWSSSTG